MKSILTLSFLLLLISCGKKSDKTRVAVERSSAVPPYDTVAIDSFSVGATSVDVARKIKISSLKYQDSLRKIQTKLEEEKLLNKMEDEKEKLDKKAADDKKKAEDAKKKQAEVHSAENVLIP
ncbi:hypothetical protein KSK37_11515 [Kaistella sp. DKR-2]|uniref:hypothetical protein n=1 Tax=Kaistella soli TaxID=2849654 RepID=UPI001C26F96A|nr:hypothetical protein [Kaistella soli]MBU8883712.1 hypothetical protein [Kaistella soli]